MTVALEPAACYNTVKQGLIQTSEASLFGEPRNQCI